MQLLGNNTFYDNDTGFVVKYDPKSNYYYVYEENDLGFWGAVAAIAGQVASTATSIYSTRTQAKAAAKEAAKQRAHEVAIAKLQMQPMVAQTGGMSIPPSFYQQNMPSKEDKILKYGLLGLGGIITFIVLRNVL
ncbi:MAG: hypothetical protein ACFFG0_17765 [Candidatus Thorarchaeota archaeon]